MNKKIWDNKLSKLPLVTENASWRFIYDFANFKACKGIFVFTNSSHQVKYVGHTTNNCIVDAIADAIEDGKDSGATLVKVLYTNNYKDASFIADIIKEKYSPINNDLDLKSDKKLITGINRLI